MRLYEIAEGLDNNQRRVGQVGAEEKAAEVSPVLGKKDKQHPYKGRLVGEESEQGVAEGSDNVGNKIKALYQKIYDQGDDSIDYMYHESPVFAQIWDEYEGDLDSIIAEVDPSELQVIANELEAYLQGPGLAEGRFDEPLTGWHIVYRKSGNPVHATPSFETKDQAQKYLMTKMFANHHDYKVVHTAGVGVAEGNDKIADRYDQDEWDEKIQHLKKLAGMGPLKTVWDPEKRVYKNVPVNQNPEEK